MKTRLQRKLAARKRRIKRRLDKSKFGPHCPVMSASNIHYDIADRTRGIAAGGIGMIHRMVKYLNLDTLINKNVNVLKLYMPYTESDHVLNIAYNLLAGGTCLEHLELRRNDEVYLDALGAQRIPDPTTAGDFCRRFTITHIDSLMDVLNQVRTRVWQLQGSEFFEEAVIDADGTMVETTGECKEGIDVNYKGQWGYHPLIVSLANTGEPLFIHNRSGNRPSHEHAAEYFDKSIELCRNAGFRSILLRGDTDFTQTAHLDRWNCNHVKFLFGIDAMPNLYELAESLPDNAWQQLRRAPKYEVRTTRRRRPVNVKEQVVERREFENKRLVREYVAEFRYSPILCKQSYRVVVLLKDVEVKKGQRILFNKDICFFYITNDFDSPIQDIVARANGRCNQENLIEQQKNQVRSLTAPLDNLVSNWAYMVIAALSWSLKAWSALLLPTTGRWHKIHAEEKQRLLKMDFSTYRNAWINVPAQIVRGARRILYRFLTWNPWQNAFFRLLSVINTPMRC